MFHSNYSKSLQSLFQQWDMSVEKVGQEEDSFIVSIRPSVGTNVLWELVNIKQVLREYIDWNVLKQQPITGCHLPSIFFILNR